MNYEIVRIGKYEYPIFFGFNALRKFCKITGVSLSKITQLGDDIGLDDALQLIAVGIEEGNRKSGKSRSLTVDELGDLLDEDMTILQRTMEVFGEHMGANVAGKQKKVLHLRRRFPGRNNI